MIIGIRSRGTTRELAQTLLDALTQYNAEAYRRDRTLQRIDRFARYSPDPIGRTVELVAVDILSTGNFAGSSIIVSCGTAAAAWAGWARANGTPRASAYAGLLDTAKPGLWHAVAFVEGGQWDPAVMLPGVRGERSA